MELLFCITYECMDIVYKIFRYANSVSGLCLHLRDTALKLNLSFDMCRWLIEGKDVKVVHGVLVRHHQYLTSRPRQVQGTSSSNIHRGRRSDGG